MSGFKTISFRRLQVDGVSSAWTPYQMTVFIIGIFVLIVAVICSFIGTRQRRNLWYSRCIECDWNARLELHIITRSYPIGDPRHRLTREEAENQVKQFIFKKIHPFTKTLDENDFKDYNDENELEQTENLMVEKEPFEYRKTSFDGTSSRDLDDRPTSLHTTTISSTDHMDTLHTLQEEESNTNESIKLQTSRQLKRFKFPCPGIFWDSQGEKDSGNKDSISIKSELQEVEMGCDVSADCAICLNAYSIGDKVTSSSGLSNCTHVFHQDCIVEWLMTLGKKAHRDAQWASRNNTISQINLCNFPMVCPICRQDFIPNSISE